MPASEIPEGARMEYFDKNWWPLSPGLWGLMSCHRSCSVLELYRSVSCQHFILQEINRSTNVKTILKIARIKTRRCSCQCRGLGTRTAPWPRAPWWAWSAHSRWNNVGEIWEPILRSEHGDRGEDQHQRGGHGQLGLQVPGRVLSLEKSERIDTGEICRFYDHHSPRLTIPHRAQNSLRTLSPPNLTLINVWHLMSRSTPPSFTV